MRFTFQNKHEYPLKDFPHVHAETCSVLSTSMGILCCGIKQRGDTVFPSWIHVLQLSILQLYTVASSYAPPYTCSCHCHSIKLLRRELEDLVSVVTPQQQR